MSLKLLANSNILVIGSTGAGKTTAVFEIITRKLIHPFPKKIFYLYATYQPMFDEWKDKITFVQGLKLDVINDYEDSKLLIIDDLILDISKELANHVIIGSHHKQTTTIFITHSLYLNNEFYRLISNNSQYILLFKNKRNFSQISRLATQILGGEKHRLLEAYKYIGSYEFVLLSFHPKVPDELLVITNLFDKCISVYL